MLPAGELKTEFDRVLGGRPANDVVMYCGSGVTACHNLLAMEHAGLARREAVCGIVVGVVSGSGAAR